MEIAAKVVTGSRTVAFDLVPVEGGELPDWQAGSHIELKWTTDGQEIIRQYSLCGESFPGAKWRIAVNREKTAAVDQPICVIRPRLVRACKVTAQ